MSDDAATKEDRVAVTLDQEQSRLQFAATSFRGFASGALAAPSCSRELLEASHPSIPLGLQDWCGEITNQVVGRIKSRLAEMNVHFNMETPVPLPIEGKSFKGPDDCKVFHLEFERCSEAIMKVSLWIDLSLEESLDRVAADSADAGEVLLFSASEGDTILF